MAHASQIPLGDRIPLREKLLFSVGENASYLGQGLMIGVLWLPYFNIGMGLDPVALTFVLMLLRAWDGCCDPFIGNFTDNARTRWGRRRPFILLGAVLCGALYPLFWHVPTGLGENGTLVYITIIGLLFFTADSIWGMSYYGLQMELTPNYDERTRLSGWMAFFSKIARLSGGWVLALVTGAWFINEATGKGDILIGMKTVSWYIAGLIIFFGALPAFFVKERFKIQDLATRPRTSFWKSVRESSRCAPLWSLIGISFFMILGSMSLGSLSQYINIYYIFDGDLAAASVVAGWKTTVLVITGIALIPFWTKLGERFDKRSMVMSMIAFSMLGHLANYFCLRPEMPYLQIIPSVFESGAISAVWLFLPSMKADTADYDELKTHCRREGSINSFFSWFIKFSGTLSIGAGGLVLSLSGFVTKATHQPPEVLQSMLNLYLFLPLAIWAFGLVIAYYYPLSRGRMLTIRAELEARRESVSAPSGKSYATSA